MIIFALNSIYGFIIIYENQWHAGESSAIIHSNHPIFTGYLARGTWVRARII